MTAPVLQAVLVLVLLALLALCVRIILDLRQRILITVARPTTTDGETVQLTANLRAAADSTEIGATLEKLSLSVQRRMVRQNELVMEANTNIAHERWLRIKAKLDFAERKGRRGVGVLSKAERLWWMQHHNDFTEAGPVLTTSEERLAAAAGDGPEGA